MKATESGFRKRGEQAFAYLCYKKERMPVSNRKNSTYPLPRGSGNVFVLPNAVFLLGLTSKEFVVYAYLVCCEDRNTYKCYPSYRKIAEHTGMSKSTVAKCVRSLEEKGLIYTRPTLVELKDGSGLVRNGTLEFQILPIQEAYNRHLEEQLRQAEAASAQLRFQETLRS